MASDSRRRYNWAALKLRRRFLQLGAQEITAPGEGDEQHVEGSQATFVPWVDGLWQQLLRSFPLENGLEPVPSDVLLGPQWLLSLATDSKSALNVEHVVREGSGLPIESFVTRSVRFLDVSLDENKRITPETHWQDVRQLSLSTQVQVDYLPGDVLTIYPQNPKEDVDEIINLMRWNNVADNNITFTRNTGYMSPVTAKPPALSKFQGENNLTLRSFITERIDLNAIPRRHFFSLLAHFTNDEFQRSRLLEFADPKYLDELYDYTSRPRRSILEVLQEFDSVKIPWQWVAEVLPELRGRQFSIASGGRLAIGKKSATRFELLVAIVKYKTVIRKLRRGVCTRYLESLPVGTSIRVSLQRGGLNVTQAETHRPILMVGPGTGVAPIRSLIWQRLAWNKENEEIMVQGVSRTSSTKAETASNVLFFGCRNSGADYFFKDEWDALQEDLPLQVFPAFSRDEGQKQYVQDLVRLHSRVVYELLYEKKGIVFVCGSSGKMPQGVREALISALEKEALLDRRAAEEYLASMEKEDRYKQETW